VEGAPQRHHLVCHANDRVSYVVYARQIASGNAQDSDAMLLEPIIAPQITQWSVAHVMTSTIDFDRETRFGAVEIENVRPERMLAAKHRLASRACSQAAP